MTNTAEKYRIERDGEGWGVQSEHPEHGWLFENQQPLATRAEAVSFRDAILQAHADSRANDRYWGGLYGSMESA